MTLGRVLTGILIRYDVIRQCYIQLSSIKKSEVRIRMSFPNALKQSLSKYARSCGKLTAIALLTATPIGISLSTPTAASFVPTAQLMKSTLTDLSEPEKATLESGEVVVSGDNGQFVARVLVDASLEDAWQVLTDYDNFELFLPHVESSELLESDGTRNVFKQVNVVPILPFVTSRSQITIESKETYPQQVDFSLVEGDLDALQGVWYLEPIGEQVLVTHQVAIDPGNGSPKGIFFSTYRNVLEGSLSAAKAEAEARAGQ